MLEALTLKNFRKHRMLDLNFTDGLNVIRGANEAGKTTILEALLYSWFGSDALRESLAMVVTEGEPESSLKVVSRFVLDGVPHTASRSASGAEITYADQRVTGQTATKQYMERMLKAQFKTTKNLMFATQGSIQGVLSEGAGANSLVETLADLAVIESWVERVQAHLPTGSTTAIEAQIETAKAAIEQTPGLPDETELKRLDAEKSSAQAKSDLSESRRPADQEVVQAQAAVDAHRASTALLLRLTARADQNRATLATPVTLPGFTAEELQEKRVLGANAHEQSRRLAAYQRTFTKVDQTFTGTEEELATEIAGTKANIEKWTAELNSAKRTARDKLILKINEDTCAFCKKDLTQVPEVAQRNAALDAEVAAANVEAAELEKALAGEQATLKALVQVSEATKAVKTQMGTEWKAADGSTLPPVPVWIGAVPVKGEDVSQDLLRMEGRWADYQFQLAARLSLSEEQVRIQKEIDDTNASLMTSRLDYDNLEVMLAQRAEALADRQALADAQRAYDSELRAVSTAIGVYEAAMARIVAARKQLEGLEATRTQMLKHNELIKKLRAARPKIAAEMWNTVLGAISHYFTQIRGTPSVVVRDAAGFKVNGRSPDGLSGSTRDALGLGIRMALSKLFLPGVALIVLDESFSACDDNRELAGISTLASAGFTQALLVTHSTLPEAVASNLILLD